VLVAEVTAKVEEKAMAELKAVADHCPGSSKVSNSRGDSSQSIHDRKKKLQRQ
jgi:hypothetical protein